MSPVVAGRTTPGAGWLVEHRIKEHHALDHPARGSRFPEAVVRLAYGRPERLVVDVEHPTAMELPRRDRRRKPSLDERPDEIGALLAVNNASIGAVLALDKNTRVQQHVHEKPRLALGEPNAVYANRRRIRGDRGQRLLRRRGELLERPCAHLYETAGLRRAHVRGHENVLKRLLVHAGAFNLGLWMRTLFGVGTPRSLQGRLAALGVVLSALWTIIEAAMTAAWSHRRDHPRSERPFRGSVITASIA